MSTIQSTLKLARLMASTGYLKYAGLLPTIVKESDYGVPVDREVYREIPQIDLGVGVDNYVGQLQKSDKDLATTADNGFLVFTPEDIADCVSQMRYVDTRCRELCSEANFLNNKDWCLTNCEVRAEDINTPSKCLRYIYHFIRTQTHLNGGDISTVEQAEPYIQGLPKVKTGDIIDPEHHNAIVDAINALSSLSAVVANPSGYSLYGFIKNVCSKGDYTACEWLIFNSSDIIGAPTYYSTDFITDSFASSHYYYRIGYRTEESHVYIFPIRASNSVGYIDIDDLNLEYEKYVLITGEPTEEYSSLLGYAFKYGEFGGVGAILSVRVKSVENLNTNAPILKIEYGVNGYLTISLTPDMKIYVEYPGGSINIDYNINERWLFIVTNLNGWLISLYDDSLNNISYLDYSSLSGEGITDYARTLYIYKGYYSTTQGKATFQYDWIVIEANATTIL